MPSQERYRPATYNEPRARQESNRKSRNPEKFDGEKIEWPDYFKHFETVAEWNGWSSRERGMQLVMSLQGEALMVLGDLPDDIANDYDALVDELTRRFNPAERETAHRVEFRNRLRKSNETAMQYGYSLKRLAAKAFPKLPMNAQEQWVMDQFVTGLGNIDIRKHVQFGHPANTAIALAVEYEAFDTNCKDKFRKPANNQGEVLLMGQYSNNNAPQRSNYNAPQRSNYNRTPRDYSNLRCYYCKECGHIQRHCPKRQSDEKAAEQPKFNGSSDSSNTTNQGN
jgi:hypothetical protein